MSEKWDRRFLALAATIAEWSKDPSTKTGAVIVRPDRTIASVGYNGFPRGMSDDLALYEDREVKYGRIIHCEINAILNASEGVRGYTLYTWPFMSCDRCAVQIIQSGIKRVVAPTAPLHVQLRWKKEINRAVSFFREAGVSCCIGFLGKERSDG